MIISRTPLRISFFGGGTDFPDWYNQSRGKVISTSIDKYSYVTARYLPPFFEFSYRLRYYIKEEVKKISSIKHSSIRETLKYLKFKEKLEIIHNADLPAQSGLGASSSFTVGLLNCLYNLSGKKVSKKKLYLNAIEIEQNKIREYVGSQDQTTCANGGANIINFRKNKIIVSPISLNNNNLKKLENSVFLVFTGLTRKADLIEKEKLSNLKSNSKFYEELLRITDQAEKKLFSSSNIVEDFADLMDEHWWLKKQLAKSVTNQEIEDIFKKGKKHGAYSGKLLGAGGGGFFMFLIDPNKKRHFTKVFKNYIVVPVKFENYGSKIIYHAR